MRILCVIFATLFVRLTLLRNKELKIEINVKKEKKMETTLGS